MTFRYIVAIANAALIFSLSGILVGCSDKLEQQEQEERMELARLERMEREERLKQERVERERRERERREAEERARACERARGLSEQAGEEIVGRFGGGRDIRVKMTSCEYNLHDEKFRTKVEIYWNGILFWSNKYNVDGVFAFNSNGSNAKFAQTYASETVRSLSFWGTMAAGVVVLGVLANESAEQ